MEKSEDLTKPRVVIHDRCGGEFEVITNNNNHPEIWY